MGPARKPEFGQDVSQDLQENGLFFVHRDNAMQATSVPAKGFNDVQAFEFLDNAPGRHLQPALANLTLQQAVDEQGQHVDEQHGFDAFVFVQIDGRNLQVTFGDREAFLQAVFLPIEGQHTLGRKVPVVGNQQVTAIPLHSLPEGIAIHPPTKTNLTLLVSVGFGPYELAGDFFS
jgi:hypothetical protein